MGKCHNPADQVSKTVGQVLVGARDELVHSEIRVAHPRHFAYQPPSHRVRSIGSGQRHGIVRVLRSARSRLADLAAVDSQVVVHEDLSWQRFPSRQQDGGPVHGVEAQDALADDVYAPVGVGPPAFVVGGVAGAIVQRSDVVPERIPPDVYHLARVVWYADPPASCPRDRSGRAEVLEAAGYESEHFVSPAGRFDPQLPRADQVMQLRGIPGQPEEPVLLGDELRWDAVLGTIPVIKLGLGVELLAANAVQPFVGLAIQVAAAGTRAPELLHSGPVSRVAAGANEVVKTERQVLAQASELAGIAVHQVSRADPLRGCGENVLQ